MSVTVVVLAHNDARTVGATLGSVAAQTSLAAIGRVLLADDASQDGTIAAARAAWTPSEPRLEVLTTSSGLGQWRNLNRALHEAAHSPWLVVLHADDWVEPAWLESLEQRVQACAADVATIGTSWNTVFDDGRREPGEHAADPVRRIQAGPAAVADTLLRGCWWKLSGAAIRTAAFLEIGDFEPAFPHNGDWEWLLRALARNWSVEYIPRALVNYRQHAATVSTWAFEHDVDIRESLLLLQRYGAGLPRAAQLGFIAQRARFLGRRVGRAVVKGDVRRLGTAAETTAQLTAAAVRSLF